ncbi:hypothetical protein SAMN05877753_10179 [Bacillus oleivorans]|uniref:Uncharacterized protein n=1 Tax=Bacillus oleivorans TaxID=1448271 RepID=A0A285CIC7_9BACI|nr:hypothetical protein [Bacillus oleivorans]SNX66768.1 hypothetical protein SAMN05877753_10179 [Bacillus oleivorans]
MKKISLLIFLLTLFIHSSGQALTWAYPFVVWDRNVYEVTEEKVPRQEIEKYIGKVKSRADDMTGEYYGNASNAYPIGTKYYKIKGISTESAIAVEVHENDWLKAEYEHDAPFHWIDYVKLTLFIIFICGFIAVMVTKKRGKTKG